jgi:hypothetical protein
VNFFAEEKSGMDLQELMRYGSLAINFLQSDSFKQLMGMMGQFGGGGQSQNSPAFPFANQPLPPWMQQRPPYHPYLNHPFAPGQPNKRVSPLENLFKLFSPKQNAPAEREQPWSRPFPNMSGAPPIPNVPAQPPFEGTPATFSKSGAKRIPIQDGSKSSRRKRKRSR